MKTPSFKSFVKTVSILFSSYMVVLLFMVIILHK